MTNTEASWPNIPISQGEPDIRVLAHDHVAIEQRLTKVEGDVTFIVRLLYILIAVLVGIIGLFTFAWVSTPVAAATPPDVSFPYCPGGGMQTAWGGWCDGKTFPDGTKWHADSFVAPFVGRVWNPIVCVVANAPAPPPLAPPGGCGGGY